MTTLGRWVHHALQEPRRYLAWPVAIVLAVVLIAVVWNLTSGRSSSDAEVWSKLDTAKTTADRVEVAKSNPGSSAATWAKLQAATEYLNQALADLPNNRDVALPTSRKALDLFEDVAREAPADSPQARVAALGKARVLEMRNELPKAIEQYELVAKDWPDSPEAAEARRYAEALKDPQAAAFYKELYAYSPTKMTLPPFGSETLPLPGSGVMPVPATKPGTSPTPAAKAPSNQPPALSPGLEAIPGLREVIEPTRGATTPAAKPNATTPAARPEAPKKPAGTQKNLPADVFAPEPKKSS